MQIKSGVTIREKVWFLLLCTARDTFSNPGRLFDSQILAPRLPRFNSNWYALYPVTTCEVRFALDSSVLILLLFMTRTTRIGYFDSGFGVTVLESIIRDPVLFVNASLPHFSTPGQSRSPNLSTLRLTLFRGYLYLL